ncbi:MBL fold metallo-hydrolase [Lysinibacillus agricola]|uniref:MBL fold metallo-hydrolase n=1 Tax=Lysinibacillus agricola TaxID=2590012 RepID=UPI003C1717D7
MEGLSTIFPVGQGLFYSCSIKDDLSTYNFVFDCGQDAKNSLTDVHNINSLINQYNEINTSGTIDMLIVSHFHADHINGINELLKNFNVKNIFIPYYQRWKNHRETFKFFLSLFELRSEETKIIIVPPSPIDNEDEINEFNFLEFTIDLENHVEKIDDYSDGEKDYNIYRFNESKIRFRVSDWYFDLFNIEISEKEYRALNKEIREALRYFGYTNLSDYLQKASKAQINSIKKWYLNAITSLGSKGDILNNTSICLLHCPIQSLYAQNPWSITLLTGDINLSNKNNLLLFDKYFSYVKNKIHVFFLPHHGSNANWHLDLINFTDSECVYICNCGVANTYKHPSLKVLKDIIQSNKQFHIVNELTDRYLIPIYLYPIINK